jgi:sucrose phosphorylase
MVDLAELYLGFEPMFPRRELRLFQKEPDYNRPALELTDEQKQKIKDKLEILYGAERAEACYPEVERLMKVHHAHKTMDMIEDEKTFDPKDRFTERDIVVITYGDQVRRPGVHPLKSLNDLLSIALHGFVNTVHILPFFPYSSDRGFAVVNFKEVDPRLGSWEDIEQMSLSFKLMFDGVINHCSSKSEYFREFLNGNPLYEKFFIAFNTKDAISQDHLQLILRPRTSDLLTPFQTINGKKFVWTTFSSDQIDLNYRHESTLIGILDVLLFYARKGVDIIRLDAATYLWWELGTSSAHLVETHALVQCIRAVFDAAAPKVGVITETNVPHTDNVSYFGDGTNEAHMIYNFGLPPLVLHSIHTGDCRKLAEWAASLEKPSDTCTYFNFLDSHDGVGLLGARGILSDAEIEAMVKKVREHGGLVSYRTSREGAQSPYELNITWFDALNPPRGGEPTDLQVDRFMASRSIALALAGVPGIYMQSITGSQLVDPVDPSELDEPRSINRRSANPERAFELLSDSQSTAYKIVRRFRELGEKRVQNPCFHPNGPQKVILGNDAVFTVLRRSPGGARCLLALTNVTAKSQEVRLTEDQTGIGSDEWRDVLSDRSIRTDRDEVRVTLAPYQVVWLEPR